VTKDYELMVILSPKLSADAAAQENDKIMALITDSGGEIVKIDDWGKRTLAYPIEKNYEGYYFVNYYRFESLEIKNFKRQLNINENLIRYMIITRDEKRSKNG
jgi:small subunit ribosomal protein S6